MEEAVLHGAVDIWKLYAQFCCESQTALKNEVCFFFPKRLKNHVDQNFGEKCLWRERGPSEKEGKESCFFFFFFF